MINLSITYKNKDYAVDVPEQWRECSAVEFGWLLRNIVLTDNGWAVDSRAYLRRFKKLPRGLVKKFYRADVIMEALEFTQEEDIYSETLLPARMGVIPGAGNKLSSMLMRDYALIGMLMQQVDLTADVKTLRKKLRLVASVVYKYNFLLNADKLWHSLTFFYRTKSLVRMFYCIAGMLRHIADSYPKSHAGGGGSTAGGIQQVHGMLNSLTGDTFGTRNDIEKYKIHKVLSYMEQMEEARSNKK